MEILTLNVENGSFSYGAHPVLQSIRFSAGPGDLVAILGPNGAGKTTLLRCITGMLRWNSGSSTLDGEPIAGMSARSLWKKVAYVPQAKSAATSSTVLQSVLLGRSSHLNLFESPKAEDTALACQILEQLGIRHLADKSCAQISGGELQMVLIARALAAQPQILILDEPESNLDFKNQLIILNTISGLAQKGMTCIFNTHYPAHALQRANKSLLLHRGGGFLFGDTAEVVTEENICKAFGVKAAIGEIETDHTQLPSVVALEVRDPAAPEHPQDLRSLAALTILLDSNDHASQVNDLLHQYGQYIIGRMGMPYKPFDMFIIHVTLDAPESIIRRLHHRISLIPDVSAKVTYARRKEPNP